MPPVPGREPAGAGLRRHGLQPQPPPAGRTRADGRLLPGRPPGALAAELCSEHVSVDGTLIESFASRKGVEPIAGPKGPGGAPLAGSPTDGNGFKPRNPDVDFHGQKRTNDTHRSRTDPEARLYRESPGQETKLRHPGHALAESRHGLIVGVAVTEANGTAEREAAVGLVDAFRDLAGWDPTTPGLDKGTTPVTRSWRRKPSGSSRTGR